MPPHFPDHPPIDWAKRVNRSWLVHSKLDERAEAWLEYLANLDDGRLLPACEDARAMCEQRNRLDDPKPWFYAGLFNPATVDEAKRFLANHRITKAAIPSMENDADVVLWMDRVGPETRDLIDRLRKGVARVRQERSS